MTHEAIIELAVIVGTAALVGGAALALAAFVAGARDVSAARGVRAAYALMGVFSLEHCPAAQEVAGLFLQRSEAWRVFMQYADFLCNTECSPVFAQIMG